MPFSSPLPPRPGTGARTRVKKLLTLKTCQGILYDMTTTKLPRHGIRYLLAKPVEPKRPVTECEMCDQGCDCEGGIEGIGCEHWSCWGRAATNECPSVAPHREHMHACTQYRKDLFAYDQQSHLR